LLIVLSLIREVGVESVLADDARTSSVHGLPMAPSLYSHEA
jgi:hypothetical protein